MMVRLCAIWVIIINKQLEDICADFLFFIALIAIVKDYDQYFNSPTIIKHMQGSFSFDVSLLFDKPVHLTNRFL